MLKFYILISKDPGRLWRHFSSNYSNLSPSEAEVVINTTDEQDERDLVEFCKDFGLSYHVTKSNGTPARGKNCLLEIFENSPHDYCVQIDGDDYLTPYGVELYKRVAAAKVVPDAICLKEQVSIVPIGTFWKPEIEIRKFFHCSPGTIDFEKMEEGLKLTKNSEETISKWLEYQKEFYSLAQKYVEGDESHSRVVFMSKKAAKYKFREDFTVGEDTLQYYALKNAHMNKELVLVCNDEAPATYIYNQTMPGTVYKESKGNQNFDWMYEFNKEVRRLEQEGILHAKDVPLLKINYTEIPNMDDFGIVGGCQYQRGEKELRLPANATMESVNTLWEKYSTSIEK